MKYGLSFQNKPKFKGSVAEGIIGGAKVLLLKPLTYMNLSGEAVAAILHYLHIELSQLLIVVDDVDLPVGQLRVKLNSSAGTHNGLKSIEEHLQTIRYARLRIGVGDREEGDLTSHVLGRFSEEEEKLLPEILDRVVETVEIWMDKGVTRAMDFANRRLPSNPSNGEINE